MVVKINCISHVLEQNNVPTLITTNPNNGRRIGREGLLSACLQIHFVHNINFGSLDQI